MNLLDFTWSTVEFITNKTADEIKVIIDQVDYPYLETDSTGWIIHLGSPAVSDENTSRLCGLRFENDSAGRTALWRLYRASVTHLSLHSFASDFKMYDSLLSNQNQNNANFAISLAEDYSLRAVMRTLWPGLMIETALANHQTHQRMKIPANQDLATRIAANLLSYTLVGRKVSSMGGTIDDQIIAAHAGLLRFSQRIQQSYEGELANDSESLTRLKLDAASLVTNLFNENSLRLRTLPALPFAEHNLTIGSEQSSLFGDPSARNGKDAFASSSISDALAELGINHDAEKLNEAEVALKLEADAMLSYWDFNRAVSKKLIQQYKQIDSSHFESFGYPAGDLAEYVRIKKRLTGRIRCALDILRMAKTSIEELTAQEYGFADIPLAIQILASKSSRNDIYLREELNSKSESWAILIDSSKSLERLVCTVRDAAVCLAEVATGMLPNSDSWACYTFNQDFNIIKDFSEPYSSEVKARIGGISTGLKTYLPDAIRIAASKLAQIPSDYKVILVVSDGYPQGYEGIDRQLLSTVEAVSKRGIALIGIGVESTAISKYFRSTCVAHDAYELMRDFVNVYYQMVSSSL